MSIEAQLAERRRKRIKLSELAQLLLPLVVLVLVDLEHLYVPNALECETNWYPLLLQVCTVVYVAFLIPACFTRSLRLKMLHLSWELAMLFFLFGWYDWCTLKTDRFTSVLTVDPELIASSIPKNFPIVMACIWGSIRLLLEGILWGVVFGVISGILCGWSRWGNYWISPLLKVVGPVPAAAWLPIAMIAMPTAHAASVFVIAVAVWFPLTLNLSSAIAKTDRKLIEEARCLGASKRDVLFRVALPAAMPAFFTGMFMGLSASFGALVFAEMLGVEAGLGWYIIASKNQYAFARVLSSVIVFIILFSLMIWLLFKIRDAVLKWQKGLIQW